MRQQLRDVRPQHRPSHYAKTIDLRQRRLQHGRAHPARCNYCGWRYTVITPRDYKAVSVPCPRCNVRLWRFLNALLTASQPEESDIRELAA